MVALAKPPRHALNGVLLLDKPKGLSSNQALQKAKALLWAKKAGHTGTLDPMASGLLPLCFGGATKWSALQLDANKTYEALVQLGQTTDTGDAEGQILTTQSTNAITESAVHAALQAFTGNILQTPPMYSALKKDGKPLYAYARAGEHVEREARAVTVHQMDWHNPGELASSTQLKLSVTVSKGTYIRVLAEDIGRALGCGAYLAGLRRTASGSLSIAQSITLEALAALPHEERTRVLQPIDVLLEGYARIELNQEDAGRFLSGQRRTGEWPDANHVAVYCQNTFLGTAHIKSGELIVDRLLSPLELA